MVTDSDAPGFNEMQNIKRKFFALRNGILADQIKKAGDTHKIIFGLSLVQLSQIAMSIESDNALAQRLWENKTTRESRLLATMLAKPEEFDAKTLQQWINDVETVEEADVLSMKLLRKSSHADKFVEENLDEPGLVGYVAVRLGFNLLTLRREKYAEKALEIAAKSVTSDFAPTVIASKLMLDEAKFYLS